MPNTKSNRKRVRQTRRNRLQNAARRSALRTSLRKIRSSISSGDEVLARQLFVPTQKIVDRLTSKGLIHRNRAARLKARLEARIRALGGEEEAGAAEHRAPTPG